MDIFADAPNSWIDLQNKVAYILQCSGFRVDTPKKIATVRSSVEFDVFAQNKDISVACECKYWKRKVPQNVVQAFRVQLDDVGINNNERSNKPRRMIMRIITSLTPRSSHVTKDRTVLAIAKRVPEYTHVLDKMLLAFFATTRPQ